MMLQELEALKSAKSWLELQSRDNQAAFIAEREAFLAKYTTAQQQLENLQNERQTFEKQQIMLRQALSANFQRREVESRTDILKLKRQVAIVRKQNQQLENTIQELQLDLSTKTSTIETEEFLESQYSEQLLAYQTQIAQFRIQEQDLQFKITELETNQQAQYEQIQALEFEKIAQQNHLAASISEMNLQQQYIQQQLAEFTERNQALEQHIEIERVTSQIQLQEVMTREQILQQKIIELEATNQTLVEQQGVFDSERKIFHTKHNEFVESIQQTIARKDAEFTQLNIQHKETLEELKKNLSMRASSPMDFLGKQLMSLKAKFVTPKSDMNAQVILTEKSLKVLRDLKMTLR
jgi:chromosome segregation ATPase